MKNDIILSGVGGQGILSIAAIIGLAAVENDLFLKQSEVHGMSQRGGDVQSHLRLSDNPVSSDLIPYGQADLIISVEPMESLRYLPWLSKDGWLVSNLDIDEIKRRGDATDSDEFLIKAALRAQTAVAKKPIPIWVWIVLAIAAVGLIAFLLLNKGSATTTPTG